MIIFLPINLNICLGCSKELSHRDGSFEYPQHMFWMGNKKNNFLIRTLIMRQLMYCSGLSRSGEKFWKMKTFPGQRKVKELHFQSGKFKKNERSHGKVREFQNFLKRC